MAAVVQDLEKTVGKIKLGAYLEFSFVFAKKLLIFSPIVSSYDNEYYVKGKNE